MPDLDVSSTTAAHSNPFNMPPRDYFVTPELTQRFNLIRHLLQNSEQLLLVLAETGCGKTSLLRQLAQLKENDASCGHWWIYPLESSPALSPEVLLAKLLAKFNVRAEGKSIPDLLETLRRHIANTRYNGQLPILLVDDAHRLPLATLKLVVELAMQSSSSQTRLRVLLLCEPQITSILATPEFGIVQNTLVHTLDIPPLSKTQTRDYIQHYLQNSQYRNVHPFNQEVMKKLYAQTEGVPGHINFLAQQVLNKFAEQRPRQSLHATSVYMKLRWSALILIGLCSVAYLVYWLHPELFNKDIAETPKVVTAPVLSAPPTVVQIPPTPPIVPLPNKPIVPVVPTMTTVPRVPEKTTLNPTPPQTEPNSSPIAKALNRTDVKDENWLRAQNADAYTVQLLGAHDLLTLKTFLNQYALTNVAIFKTEHQNKEWYVLVTGMYADHHQAVAAIEKLPAVLRTTTQPWARSLADIQAKIGK